MTESAPDYTYIRDAVAKRCARFPGEYWRELDRDMSYPSAFVDALTEAGWLLVLIPEEYGGAGLPLLAAAAILEEIQMAGCNSGACHAQMYTMGTLLRHVANTLVRLEKAGITCVDRTRDIQCARAVGRPVCNPKAAIRGHAMNGWNGSIAACKF